MNKGTIISIIVALLAISGIVAAFLVNASPYVTIAEAKKGGQGVHVVGILERDSVRADARAGTTTFSMKDEAGDTMAVAYNGPPISNLLSADRVVVVGSMKNEGFSADKILVKCPSKYEGQEK